MNSKSDRGIQTCSLQYLHMQQQCLDLMGNKVDLIFILHTMRERAAAPINSSMKPQHGSVITSNRLRRLHTQKRSFFKCKGITIYCIVEKMTRYYSTCFYHANSMYKSCQEENHALAGSISSSDLEKPIYGKQAVRLEQKLRLKR